MRSRTQNVARLSKRELNFYREQTPVVETSDRPRTRGECFDGARPCPWVSCRHHLYLDVTSKGNVKVNFPDLEVEDLPATCALDVADQGEHQLAVVGAVMNLTRERIRQLEVKALSRVRRLPVIRAMQSELGDDASRLSHAPGQLGDMEGGIC